MEIGRSKTPAALYTFVTCNKENIRDLLTPENASANNTATDDSLISVNISSNASSALEVSQPSESFIFRLPFNDFREKLETRFIRQKVKHGKKRSFCREIIKIKKGLSHQALELLLQESWYFTIVIKANTLT